MTKTFFKGLKRSHFFFLSFKTPKQRELVKNMYTDS